jgi:hypothetical protein
MAVRIGPFDPLQLIFNVMNVLIRRGYLSESEARTILKDSLNPEMPDEEKERLLSTLLKKTND